MSLRHYEMADQGQKTITIDDLVNELSTSPAKPASGNIPQSAPISSTPPPVQQRQSMPPSASIPTQSPMRSSPVFQPQNNPPSSISQGSVPRPPMPNQPAPISAINTQQRPPVPQSQNMPPKPVIPATMPPISPKPSTVQPQPMPAPTISQGVKEYQSSIRTMSGDISSLKSGQQLSGIPMPRKIEDKPVVQPSPAIKPLTPNVPAQNAPWAKIEMGQLEKSATLNNQSSASQASGQNSNKPLPPPLPITIPERKAGINRNVMFLGIAVIALIVVGAYWFFILRTPSEPIAEIPTPTPVISETPTPTPTPTLGSIITGQPMVVELPASGDSQVAFKNTLKSSSISAGKIQSIQPSIKNGEAITTLKPDALLDKLLVAYPISIKPILAEQDSYFYYFGQSEAFNTKGVLTPGTSISQRLVVISEVNNSTLAIESMKAWETTMPTDLNLFFDLGYKKGAKATFLDNIYKGNSIRYINFPWPDRSIDYSFIRASNGKSYLVMSNSRQAMYSAIDRLILR